MSPGRRRLRNKFNKTGGWGGGSLCSKVLNVQILKVVVKFANKCMEDYVSSIGGKFIKLKSRGNVDRQCSGRKKTKQNIRATDLTEYLAQRTTKNFTATNQEQVYNPKGQSFKLWNKDRIIPFMTTEARAVFLAKLVSAKMNISSKPRPSMKSCNECDFTTNKMPILTKHRALMHAGRKPAETRGRKRKADPAAPAPEAKRTEQGDEQPIVNAIYLQDSQDLSSQMVDSQESGEAAETSSYVFEQGDSQPPLPAEQSNDNASQVREEAAGLNTQDFDLEIQERLDLLENDDEDAEDEAALDDIEYGGDEYEEENDSTATSTTLSLEDYNRLLRAARDSHKELLRQKKEHEAVRCQDQIADLKCERERIRLQALKAEKDRDAEVKRRERAEGMTEATKDEAKAAKSIISDLKARLSVKNQEVDQLRLQAGINGAKMLSLQALQMSPPPPEAPASAARPTAGQAKVGDKAAERKQPKDTRCRFSDRDQMCSRPRCGFFHPRASDHCEVFLQGGACRRQTCMKRHNEAERTRFQQKQMSNARKRTRSDRDSTSNKRRRSSSRRRSPARSLARSPSHSSPQGHRGVSDYSQEARNRSRTRTTGREENFARPDRRAAGRSLGRRPDQPSRK